MITNLLTDSCQIVARDTAGSISDDYGNLIPTNAGTTTVACVLQQIRREEPGDEGEFSSTVWSLFLPTGTTIDTSDRVVHNGSTYEVVGDPWDATEGTPDVWHCEATVVRRS